MQFLSLWQLSSPKSASLACISLWGLEEYFLHLFNISLYCINTLPFLLWVHLTLLKSLVFLSLAYFECFSSLFWMFFPFLVQSLAHKSLTALFNLFTCFRTILLASLYIWCLKNYLFVISWNTFSFRLRLLQLQYFNTISFLPWYFLLFLLKFS